jgi:hypothetical protein
VLSGVEAATPVAPKTPTNYLLLAEIYHRVAETSIKNADDTTNGYITDKRSLNGYHNQFLPQSQSWGDVIITNQTQWEYWFGDGTETGTGYTGGGWAYSESGIVTVTMPENTTVFLMPCVDGGTTTSFNGNSAYIMKTQVNMSSNTVIKGFNVEKTVVVKDDDSTYEDDIKFITTYKYQSVVASISGASFSGITNYADYSVGDLIHTTEDNTFYTVVSTSSADGGTVTVNSAISGSYSGVETISSMVTGITHEGWSFDGRGGINGYGGAIDGTDKNGGAYNIQFCGKSTFNNKIINHAVSYSSVGGLGGGIYSDGNAAYIEALNIYSCASFGTASGGGAYGCDYSTITAYNCSATGGGGGACGCDYSTITAYNCTATGDLGGGGAYGCDYSTITAYNCTATIPGTGDIAYSCENSESIWGNSGTIIPIVSCTLGGVRLGHNHVANDGTAIGTVSTTGAYVRTGA